MIAKKDAAMKKNSKAIGAGVGVAIASLVVWGLSLIPGVVDIPAGVEAAIAVIITTLITWVAPANELPGEVK